MKKATIVPTELTMTATAELQQSVEADLNVADPTTEKAKAALDEGNKHESSNGDQPAG